MQTVTVPTTPTVAVPRALVPPPAAASAYQGSQINRRNGALNSTGTTLVNYLANNLGTPSVVAGINTPFRANAHGHGGVISVPNFATIFPNASPVTQTAMETNPVNSQVRNGNNCTPPISAGNQQSGGT